MDSHEPTNVLTAFEMLLEEVENEIEFVNASGARAFAGGDYGQVDIMRSLAQMLTDFRERAAALRKEWQDLAAQFEPAVDADQSAHIERRNWAVSSAAPAPPKTRIGCPSSPLWWNWAAPGRPLKCSPSSSAP